MGTEVRHRLYREHPEGQQIKLEVRQTFNLVNAFRDGLKEYVILKSVVLMELKMKNLE